MVSNDTESKEEEKERLLSSSDVNKFHNEAIEFLTKELRNAMIISVCIYILSALYLISNFGNLGLWISLSIFFIARALSLFIYLGRIYKRIT